MSVETVLNQLKAELILNGSWILEEIKRFSSGLKYEDGDQVVAYKTYYHRLLCDVEALPSLSLQPVIAPGTSRAYLIDLTCGLERVFDDIEVAYNQVLFFQSKVKSATMALKNLRDTFKAWYLIGLQEELKRFEIKLPNKSLDSLSDSEFNRLLGDSGSDLEALDLALGVLTERLKARKKLAQEKYNIGKDQANASLLPMLGQAGYSEGRTGEELLREKYGLGERQNMVMDDPDDGVRIVSRRKSDPPPVVEEEDLPVATASSMVKTVVVDVEPQTIQEDYTPDVEIPMEEEPPAGIFTAAKPSEVRGVSKVRAAIDDYSHWGTEVEAESKEDSTYLTTPTTPSKRKPMFDDEDEVQVVPPQSEPQCSTPLEVEKPTVRKRRIIFDED
jgi:hypothetical protein